MTRRAIAGLMLAVGVVAQDRSRICLAAAAATDNLWVFAGCCDPVRATDPRLVAVQTQPEMASVATTTSAVGSWMDADGMLWVLTRSGRVLRFIPPGSGTPRSLLLDVSVPGAVAAHDLAFDCAGDPWIAIERDRRGVLVRIDRATGLVMQDLTDPNGVLAVATHSNGFLYWSNGAGHLMTADPAIGQASVRLLATHPTPGRAFGDVVEGPAGELWTGERDTVGSSSFHSRVRVLGLDGTELAVSSDRGTDWPQMSVVPRANCVSGQVECWSPGIDGPVRRALRNGAFEAEATIDISGGAGPLALDGRGRAWLFGATHVFPWVWFGDTAGTLPSGTQYPRYSVPGVAHRGGDPAGMQRAMTVDRGRDDDGDGVVNLVEANLLTDPFDAASRPALDTGAAMQIDSPQSIGASATWRMFAPVGAHFLAFLGVRARQPLLVAGVAGRLEVDPPTLLRFADSFATGAIGSGVVAVETLLVPNEGALSGLSFAVQGVVIRVGELPTFSSTAELRIQ